jgi:hypothetical protein
MKILICKKSWANDTFHPEFGLVKGQKYKVIVDHGAYIELSHIDYDYGPTVGVFKYEMNEYFYSNIILSSNIKVL